MQFPNDQQALLALEYLRESPFAWADLHTGERRQLTIQTNRSFPARFEGKVRGHFCKLADKHIKETNPEWHGWQLLQNGGELHVVVGPRTYSFFSARVHDSCELHVSPMEDNLTYHLLQGDAGHGHGLDGRSPYCCGCPVTIRAHP